MEQGDHIHKPHHAVQFYGDDEHLVNTVGGFLSEGLVEGQPAIVIATAAHTSAILDELTCRHIDIDHAKYIGDLVLLDADETLATFMAGDAPDANAFKKNVGEILDQAVRGRFRTPVRAYGEMVDVLWKKGKVDAAIKLEILWNELAHSHSFQLLCGYAMGNFFKKAEYFEKVCQQHTSVSMDAPLVAFQRRA